MAKQMLSTRIEVDLRDLLVGEAGLEGRSVSNMVERILHERYTRGAVLTERGALLPGLASVTPRPSGQKASAQADPPPRSVSTKPFKPDFKGG